MQQNIILTPEKYIFFNFLLYSLIMSWHCKKYSLLYNTLTSNQKAIKSTNKNRVWEKVTSLPFLEKFPIKIGAGAIYLEAVLQMPNEILARKLLYRQAGEASPTPPYNHSYKKPALRYRMGRATAAPQVKQKKTTKCKRINEPNTLGEPAGRKNRLEPSATAQAGKQQPTTRLGKKYCW